MRIPGLKRFRREVVRIRGRLFGGGVVLGYHRVALDPEDPHGLVVSPDTFEEHLEVIRRRFRPVRLAELLAAAGGASSAQGRAERLRPLALTFDDGYADVLLEALPRLERFRMPVTVFVVTGSIGRNRFPWDEPRNGAEGRPLTVSELRRLAASPWVEIGGHTRSHPDLREVSLGEARHELRHSRARLEELLARRVESFAFPHGGASPALRRLVARVGYRRACDSSPGLVDASTDPFSLPRFWPPDVGERVFEGWLGKRVGTRGRATKDDGSSRRPRSREVHGPRGQERLSEISRAST